MTSLSPARRRPTKCATVRVSAKSLKSSKSTLRSITGLSLEAVYSGKGDEVDVIDFFGRDEALACLCFACAEMLSSGTLGKSKRVADLTRLIASFLLEKYTAAASEKPDWRK